MTINRIWMRLNLILAVVMLGAIIYSWRTGNMQVLRVALVAWAASYVMRLVNNKCKQCGQSFNEKNWRSAGDGYKICPRCGTRHRII